jgi:hypothetical protein
MDGPGLGIHTGVLLESIGGEFPDADRELDPRMPVELSYYAETRPINHQISPIGGDLMG